MADGKDHGILPGKGIPDRVLADLRSNENDRLNYYSGRRHRDPAHAFRLVGVPPRPTGATARQAQLGRSRWVPGFRFVV